MSTLLATTGYLVGRRFKLNPITRLGRAPDNDIVLPDNSASRYHVKVEREGGTFVVSDAGSKNGFLVNNRALKWHRLKRGDELQLGETTLVFDAPQEVRAARFTNTLIHFVPEQDETMRLVDAPADPEPQRNETTDLIQKISSLVDISSGDLPGQLKAILKGLMTIFGATGASLLIKSRDGEALPLTAIARGEKLRLNRSSTDLALNEGRSVLSASFFDADSKPVERKARKAMIVPLFEKDEPFAAIHLERPEGSDYTLQDIHFLQAVSKLVSSSIRQAIQMDRLSHHLSGEPVKIIGNSPPLRKILDLVERIAPSDSSVLITGETGTGKELVARSLHEKSSRASGPFVAINCAAIPANLIESELFGYERGAFTGADRMTQGKIDVVEGGTLFLDEIGEMDIQLQPKLLRYLEERIFYRVGGVLPIKSDVRILTATNRNLDQAVNREEFRSDLLFRLNTMQIELPPLRDRREDIRPIVEHYAPELAARMGKPFIGVSDSAWMTLEKYSWPGNIRELVQCAERAIILSESGLLEPEHFQLEQPSRPADRNAPDSTNLLKQNPGSIPNQAPQTLAQVEKQAIITALRYSKGSKNKAAEILEIHRNTLRKKIEDYGIDIDEFAKEK